MARRAGFTLVELSIVIVIIGLIVAGVMAGQSLMKQAKMRNITTDAQKIQTAAAAFLMQYSGLPGDLANAESYFGTYAGGMATTGALNGNGNKAVGGWPGDIAAHRESKQFYRQLVLAGLLSGTPLRAEETWVWQTGIDFPVSAFGERVGYSIYYYTPSLPLNMILFGKEAAGNDMPWNAFLTVAETLNLDKKFDDGVAATGNLRGTDGYPQVTTCLTASAYDLTLTGIRCGVMIKLGY